jgi:hypothetical protein
MPTNRQDKRAFSGLGLGSQLLGPRLGAAFRRLSGASRSADLRRDLLMDLWMR